VRWKTHENDVRRTEIENNIVCEHRNRKRFDEVNILFVSGPPPLSFIGISILSVINRPLQIAALLRSRLPPSSISIAPNSSLVSRIPSRIYYNRIKIYEVELVSSVKLT
jgi:hypothetical protein